MGRLVASSGVVLVLAASCAVAAAPERQDLVLAVDVSHSMVVATPNLADPKVNDPPSDKEGMRWDGLQFAIDVARPDDRVALVLFRGSAVVPTKLIERDSGFITLGKPYPEYGFASGRALLKALVAELQAVEAAAASTGKRVDRYDLKTLLTVSARARGAAPPALPMWQGTSVLHALRAIESEIGLAVSTPARQTHVLVFTDGVEFKPDLNQEAPRDRPAIDAAFQDVAALDSLRKTNPAAVPGWVAERVRTFKAKKVPIITFGIGAFCDQELLRLIAEQSQATEQEGVGDYGAKTNLQVLKALREVVWELREYWIKKPRAGDARAFTMPVSRHLHELGLLLYRNENDVATCPTVPFTLKPGRPDSLIKVREPFRSKSHLYYDLSQPNLLGVRDDGLVLTLQDRPDDYVCFVAARTRTDLLQYRAPLSGGRYSPKDAIPFEIEFKPIVERLPGGDAPDVPFEAEQFQVTATLTPAHPPDAVKAVMLTPKRTGGPESAAATFTGALVLDDELDSTGANVPPGPYIVHVVIHGKAGPLDDFERRLIRRTITIDKYPPVVIGTNRIELSNRDRSTAAVAVSAGLDLKTNPDQPLANLSATIEPGPKGGLGADAVTVGPSPLTLASKIGTITVSLQPDAWDRLAVGDHDAGRLRVRAPWQGPSGGATVPIVVHKARYPVVAPALEVSLDSTGAHQEGRGAVAVRLDTNLDGVAEDLWLSDSAAEGPAPRELKFAPRTSGGPVTFQVEGLGKAGKASKTADPRTAPTLFLSHEGPLPTGEYTHPLWLVGPAIKPLRVDVSLLVDQPRVLLDRPRLGRTPLADHELVAVAGTKVRHALLVWSDLKKHALADLELVPAHPFPTDEATGTSKLGALTVAPRSTAGGFDLQAAIPRSVRPGRYQAQLNLRPKLSPDKPPRTIPVKLEVIHHAVQPEKAETLRLKPVDCASKTDARFALVTESKSGEFRWSAALGDRASPVDAKHLDLRLNGQSVLGDSAPTDTVKPGERLELTVAATTDGLAPGLYPQTIRFSPRDDDGQLLTGADPSELRVELLVPGRTVRIQPALAAQVERDAPCVAVVTCYACPPASGALVALDAHGRVDTVEKALGLGPAPEPEPRADPDVATYQFPFDVAPRHAGKNVFRVRWPDLCAGRMLVQEFALDAKGRIAVFPWKDWLQAKNNDADKARMLKRDDPGPVYTGEKLLIRAHAVASTPEIKLTAVNPVNGPFPITLYDDGLPEHGDDLPGDGVYSYVSNPEDEFKDHGTYELTLAKLPGATVPPLLQPVKVPVAINITLSDDLGQLAHSGGWLRSLVNNHEHLRDPEVLKFTNDRKGPCEWTAQLLFPRNPTINGQVVANEVPEDDGLLPQYDESTHLVTGFLGNPTDDPPRTLTGTLTQGEEATLGLDCKFSDQVLKALYNGEGKRFAHLINGPSGVVIDLKLNWPDDHESRHIRFPVTIKTWSLEFESSLFFYGVLLLAAGALGYAGWRYWKWRARRAPAAPAETDPLAPPPTPRASRFRRTRKPTPGPDESPPDTGPDPWEQHLPEGF